MRWLFILMFPVQVFAQDTLQHFLVDTLPALLDETSGLAYMDQTLWTFADGGGAATIFQLDTVTASILRTVIIDGATNKDWEDIAHDHDHIYIGDFGNNAGDRTDLMVYRVRKDSVLDPSVTSVVADTIEFNYADQFSFTPAPEANNFDCEAMIAVGDSLYIFTKRWLDERTMIYAFPNVPGNYSISPIDSLNSFGLITGADADDNGLIILSGYRQTLTLAPFAWSMEGYSLPQLSNGDNLRWVIDQALMQLEGVALASARKAFLSSENLLNFVPARLWFTDIPLGQSVLQSTEHEFTLVNGAENFFIQTKQPGTVRFSIYTIAGKLVSSGQTDSGSNIELPHMDFGIYLLLVKQKGKAHTFRIVR